MGIPLFVATLKRGAILLGAYDSGRLIGFVFSFPGLKAGRPMQWSHMLAVRPECRVSGIGRELKLEQRRVSLAMGIDLMEWTFDPLVAVNAHLNFRRLGVVVEEYVVNVYGDSVSPLHRGARRTGSSRNGGCVRRAWKPRSAARNRRPAGTPGAMCRVSTPSIGRATGSPAAPAIWSAQNLNWRSRSRPLHRHAGAPARPRARVAHGHPRDVPRLSLERLPGRRLLVRPGGDEGIYRLLAADWSA